MRLRLASITTLVCGAMLIGQTAPATIAQDRSPLRSPPITYDVTSPLAPPPGFNQDNRRVTVMMELDGSAAITADTPDAVAIQSSQNRDSQQLLMASLQQVDAEVLFQTSIAYNGIAVSVPLNQVSALESFPDVVGTHIITPKERSSISATAFSGAPVIWSSPRRAAGDGVRIGVIDTGIDYAHATFGGPGNRYNPATNNPNVIEEESFPTEKVVGGFDFAGNDYDASGENGSMTPSPDPDPLDCQGHGTHVASTTAGFGVKPNGQTYQDDYSGSYDFSEFLVGPGVAPEASLYALKVFGCEGTTALTTLAIEWALDPNGDGAIDDRLDVLALALGSSDSSPNDPDAVAVQNAVDAGIVVVTAAGDSGDTFYSVDAPASATGSIAVGAALDPSQATADAPAGSLASFTARGPQRGGVTKPDLVSSGINILSAKSDSGNEAVAMTGTSMATAEVVGAAALLRQLNPEWTPQQIKAALMNTAASTQDSEGNVYPPSLTGAGRMTSVRLDSLDLLAYVEDDEGAVSLSYGVPWLSEPWTDTRNLVIDNPSDYERVVNLSSRTTATEDGVVIEVPDTHVTVPPQEKVTVPVQVKVEPGELDNTPDPTMPLRQSNLPRYFLAEHSGFVQVETREDVQIRVANASDIPSVGFYIDFKILDAPVDQSTFGLYRSFEPKRYTFQVRELEADPSDSLITKRMTLDELRNYSFLFIGRDGRYDLLVVDDTAPEMPAEDQAFVRFVNASRTNDRSPGPLDVYIDNELQTRGLDPRRSSDFIPVAPGKYTAQFFLAGSTPSPENLIASETFGVTTGQVAVVAAGRYSGETCSSGDRQCEAAQRGFSTTAQPRVDERSIKVQVPFQVFPKSASEVSAVDQTVRVPPDADSFSFDLRNTGSRNVPIEGSFVSPQVPMASVLELVQSSPSIPDLDESTRVADLEYLGITNNLSEVKDVSIATIFFGTASYGAWSTPNDVQFQVYFDIDNNGEDDYVLVNTNIGAANGIKSNDVFVSILYEIRPDGTLAARGNSYWNTFAAPTVQTGLDSAPYNTAVAVQSVSARLLRLTNTQSRFWYRIETRSRDAEYFDRVVDRVPSNGYLEYDLMKASVTPVNTEAPLGNRPIFVSTDGAEISGAIDPATLRTKGQQELLVLYHHNDIGAQTEIVTLSNGLVNGERGRSGRQPSQTDSVQIFLPLLAKP
ncbi:MAG: S8 family serine peptidase [Chloroflexota bacterium]